MPGSANNPPTKGNSGSTAKDSPLLPNDVDSLPSGNLAKIYSLGAKPKHRGKSVVMSTSQDLSLRLGRLKIEVDKNKAELCNQVVKQLDHLPNEMLAQILSNINIMDLFYLRLVNSRWQAVIEAICLQKRSLIISVDCENYIQLGVDPIWLKVEEFAVIKINKNCFSDHESEIKLSSAFYTFLTRLFPNIERLIIVLGNQIFHFFPMDVLFNLLGHWKHQLTALSLHIINMPHTTDLSDCINSMENLKQLAIGTYVTLSWDTITPTLARLERFSFNSTNVSVGADALKQLGPQCTHVSYKIHDWDMFQDEMKSAAYGETFHASPHILAQVTNLRLGIELGHIDIYHLRQHATSLQVLSIASNIYSDYLFELSRIPHLIELNLQSRLISISESFNLHKLNESYLETRSGVRVLRMSAMEVYVDIYPDMAAFCRILSRLFPALQELYFHHNGIIPNLHQFPNLRKYKHIRE